MAFKVNETVIKLEGKKSPNMEGKKNSQEIETSENAPHGAKSELQ